MTTEKMLSVGRSPSPLFTRPEPLAVPRRSGEPASIRNLYENRLC